MPGHFQGGDDDELFEGGDDDYDPLAPPMEDLPPPPDGDLDNEPDEFFAIGGRY